MAIAEDNGATVSFCCRRRFRYIAQSATISPLIWITPPTPAGADPHLALRMVRSRNFGSDGEARELRSHPLAPKSAGLAYLALGDWHRQIQINERIWYSGTPEPDQFKLPPDTAMEPCGTGGKALLVDSRRAPRDADCDAESKSARYRWHQVSETLIDDLPDRCRWKPDFAWFESETSVRLFSTLCMHRNTIARRPQAI